MTMARFTTGSVRGIAATMLLFAILTPAPNLFAVTLSPGRRTSPLRSRHGEFRHRDYPAALAGSLLPRTTASSANAHIGWVNASTAWADTTTHWDLFVLKLISDYPMSRNSPPQRRKIGQIYTKQGDREKRR